MNATAFRTPAEPFDFDEWKALASSDPEAFEESASA